MLDNHNQCPWLMIMSILGVIVLTDGWANLHPYVEHNCDYNSNVPGIQMS